MRVRKATIAGNGVNPSAFAQLAVDHAGATMLREVPYELELSLGDLRPEFFRRYAEWMMDMREYPDPDDEIEAQLRALRWPSLAVLLEVSPELFAVILLVLGREVLDDLEHGRDAMVAVEYIPRGIEEVELRGRRIVVRGPALAIPARTGPRAQA